MSDLSEFTSVDVDEMHLVGVPANGVPSPLLAKAAEALEETADELTVKACGDDSCEVCADALTKGTLRAK